MVFPFGRALALVFRPQATWLAVAAHPTPVPSLLLGYALPLASIGAAATFVALHVVGIPFAHGLQRASTGAAAVQAGLSLATALASVPVTAAVVTLLAPLFDARPDFMKALRVTVYSLTPAWLGGIFFVYAPLGSLDLLAALYGIWELSVGLARVMGAPERRAPMFAVVAAVASLIAGFGIGVFFGILGSAARSAWGVL